MTLVSEELMRHEGRVGANDSLRPFLARPAIEVSSLLRSPTSHAAALRNSQTPPPSSPAAGFYGSPFTPTYEVDKLDVAERLAAAVAQRLRKSHSPRISLGESHRTPTPPRSAAAYLAELQSSDAMARASSMPNNWDGRIAAMREASDEVRDLVAELAAESAVARSRQEEAQEFRNERNAVQAEWQQVLAIRRSDEEQRELVHWQAGCAELPVLRAQLQTTELEECAASERSTQVEAWLHGAAAEAREALATARQMAAAEATCLAEISASDAARDRAHDEMRQMHMQLLNVESDHGALVMYNEEAEVAMKWRRRAQDVEVTSEARIEELESRLRPPLAAPMRLSSPDTPWWSPGKPRLARSTRLRRRHKIVSLHRPD